MDGAGPGASGQSPGRSGLAGRRLRWTQVFPFFLSAVFFFSGIFAIFAPLPLVTKGLQSRRIWAWLAIASNSAAVAFLVGPASMAFYLATVGTIGLVLPEVLKRKSSLTGAVAVTLAAMLAVSGLGLGAYGLIRKVDPIAGFHAQVTESLKTVVDDLSPEARSEWFGVEKDAGFDEIRQAVLIQLPSALAIIALLWVWVSLVLALRLNPGSIRERMGVDPGYFRRWKAPEILVWPTLLSAALVLFDLGPASVAGLNLLKFLLAIYAIQGLSILSFFFDVWGIRGLFRSLGYSLAVFLVLPLLLGLGFFDLWFDFRAKLRQP